MCGIAGYITTNKNLSKEIDTIQRHRGQDDSGQYSKIINNKNLYFSHNRLSFIDLSKAGHQPMISEDGNVVLIYNGEIYNYEELRKNHLFNVTFLSHCDTEVVLRLYIKFGINFIKELNGDFAMAIFDRRISKIYLIRDHFGVKPLYYYQDKHLFAFGSEIKAILASGIKPKLNNSSLSDYFVFKYTPLQETLFEGVQRLPPAHYLEYDINTSHNKLNCYWKISKIKLPHKKQDLKNQLFELIKNAVEIRLMADVPVGTFFS
jgi:asparagine synthase (glutamine-hydrolysing)